MKNYYLQHNTIRGQHGAVTMFFVLMLMFLMAIMALAVGKFAMVEQETVGADYRTKEAEEATTAGLEYALAWFDDDNKCANCPAGTKVAFEGGVIDEDGVTVSEMGNIVYTATGETGYVYNPVVTVETGNAFASSFMHVEASLDATGGSAETGVSITGKESVWTTQWNQFLAPGGNGAPPIVINGCLVNTVGTPTVYPAPGGVAVLSIATNTPVDWSDPNAPTGYCLDPGHLAIETCSGDVCAPGDSGTAVNPADLPVHLVGNDLTLNPAPQAWNYLFDISLPDAMAAAAAAGQSTSNQNSITELQPTNDNYVPFIVYTGSNPITGQGVYGTINYPVVLIISDGGCPQFNGGSTIYGFMYYQNPLGTCNGMGGATVIGSGVFEGNATKLNSNTEFFDSSLLGGGSPGGPLFVEHGARIPGTWRDW